MSSRHPLSLLVLLLLIAATPARAEDHWVDAVNGSDTNTGSSPTDAWRTITHSIQQIAGTDTLHVLPGTYDTAHGEVFPFRPPSGLTIVGEAGPEVTILSGGTVFDLDAANQPISLTVEGLTVRLSVYAFRCRSTVFLMSHCIGLTLRDVVLDRCSFGVHFRAFNVGPCHGILLENVHVTGGFRGLDLDHSEFSDVNVTVNDSSFEGLNGAAIAVFAGIETLDDVRLNRTRIVDCGDGIRASQQSSGAVTVYVDDSLIAGCANGIVNDRSVFLRRSTIADNTWVGVEGHCGTVTESILFGNGQDLAPGSCPSVTETNVGSGVVPGTGNISVDPLFRDPVQRDYRLGFGTGCVDAVGGSGGPDLSGFTRGNDGDLDLAGARDMGALELRALDMPATLAIGEKLHIDYHAEVGEFAVLYLARTAQLPAPLATPFGMQWLPPNFLELVGMQKSLTPRPMRRTVPIPNSPALVGQAFSFQALSRSSAAPQGAAWTDAATVTFTL